MSIHPSFATGIRYHQSHPPKFGANTPTTSVNDVEQMAQSDQPPTSRRASLAKKGGIASLVTGALSLVGSFATWGIRESITRQGGSPIVKTAMTKATLGLGIPGLLLFGLGLGSVLRNKKKQPTPEAS